MAKRVNLLEGNIASSLTKLALPLMGMSFLQMAYNLTDMFWIGNLGTGAVASVGTGGLISWLFMGCHSLAQLGGQVYVAQNLGADKKDEAANFAHSSILLSFGISVFLGLIVSIFITPIVGFFNLNEAQVIADAQIYIIITCGFAVFQLMAKLLTALITTTGDGKTPFIATGFGLVINMILDPMLIFGFGFIPALGVAGAGIATVLAQVIVLSVLLLHVAKDTHLFGYINFKKLPSLFYFKKIIKLSFPATIQMSLFPLISMYVSRMVADFGDSAVAVQRVGSQIESISWMTSEGFAVAVNSFVAQNFGANNIKRAKKGFFQSAIILSAFGLFSTLLLGFCAEPIFKIFLNEAEVLKMGVDYLVILAVSQIFMCIEILSSNSMNALGKSVIPSTISITFTAMRIPLAMFLITTPLKLNGIWWAISISSITKGISLFLAIIVIFQMIKSKTKN